MRMKALVRSPFVAAVLGGLVVAAVFLATGITGHRDTKTIVEEGPVAAEPASSTKAELTPHEIYVRDAPGVVFVRAQEIEQVQNPFDLFPEQQSSISTGSGFPDRSRRSDPHQLPRGRGRKPGNRRDRPVRGRHQPPGDRRRAGPRQRPGAAQGQHARRTRRRAARRSATRARSRSAIPRSRSATRSASTGRSPAESCPRSSARSRRPTGSRSTT